MSFPIIERDPVRLPTLAGHDKELWDTLIELGQIRPQTGHWSADRWRSSTPPNMESHHLESRPTSTYWSMRASSDARSQRSSPTSQRSASTSTGSAPMASRTIPTPPHHDRRACTRRSVRPHRPHHDATGPHTPGSRGHPGTDPLRVRPGRHRQPLGPRPTPVTARSDRRQGARRSSRRRPDRAAPRPRCLALARGRPVRATRSTHERRTASDFDRDET